MPRVLAPSGNLNKIYFFHATILVDSLQYPKTRKGSIFLFLGLKSTYSTGPFHLVVLLFL